MGTADAVMHRAHHAHPAGQSRARGAVASAFSIFYLYERKDFSMSHPEWNQCIECSVVSCKHHNDHGHCSLDKIKVEPTPMAYTGEAADESMCGNYNCK